MRCRIYVVVLFFIIFNLIFIPAQSQIVISQAANAADMAQTLAGPGVVVLNAQMGGQCPLTVQNLISGNGIGAGKFNYNGSASNINIDNGIVLTTGNASAISNSPSGFYDGYLPNGNTGDAVLNSYLGNNSTRDACVLEFDLVASGSNISFDYVFASREYPTFNCSQYNDIFAFFISGPGLPTGLNNIALVPNTNIPVRINSVNSGVVGSAGGASMSNCTNMGAGSPFSQYYVSNNNNQFPNFYYTGFTTVLTAQANVNPCDTYHLRLSIADVSDQSYDSGVFLKGGSLISNGSTTITPVSAPGANEPTIPHCVRGCNSGKFTFSRPVASAQPQVVQYQISGTAVNGTDYTTIPTSVTIPANQTSVDLMIQPLLAAAPTGPKTVTLQLLSTQACGPSSVVDSATVTIYDSLFININTPPVTTCNATQVSVTAEIDANLNYTWSPAAASSSLNGNIVTALLDVPPLSYILTVNQPGAPATCPTNSRTFQAQLGPFILNDTTVAICKGQTYEWNGNILNDSGFYTDTFTTSGGCDSIVNLELIIDDYILKSLDTTICEGQSLSFNGQVYYSSVQIADTFVSSAGCDSIVNLKLTVLPTSLTEIEKAVCAGEFYVWNQDTLRNPGTYQHVYSSVNGCDSIVKLHLTYNASFNLSIEKLDDDISYCLGQEINLRAHGADQYLWWTSNGGTWTQSNVSIILEREQNTIWLSGTSQDNCSDTVSLEVRVDACCQVFIPNAFTPNNDGRNDYFKVESEGALKAYHFQIKNRYGQTVWESFKVTDKWDGTLNGKACDAGVYFYHVKGQCMDGTEVKEKGDITLLR